MSCKDCAHLADSEKPGNLGYCRSLKMDLSIDAPCPDYLPKGQTQDQENPIRVSDPDTGEAQTPYARGGSAQASPKEAPKATKRVKATFSMSKDVLDRLAAFCAATDRKMSPVVERAITEYLERNS